MRFPRLISFTLAVTSAAAIFVPAPVLADSTQEQRFPDVVGVKVKPAGSTDAERRFDFDVTISSPYDSPSRYADGFRVKGRDGTVYGVRKLWHDHASEQPFTRDLHGVSIPRDVSSVTVEARDQQHGWGGETLQVILPRR